MLAWLRALWDAWRNPFDVWHDTDGNQWDDSYPHHPHHGDDHYGHRMECPDTEPSDQMKLESRPVPLDEVKR